MNQANIVLDKLNTNDFKIYFFVLDTKGNPTAGIANIYEHVKVLNELGYQAYILHEKNNYHGVQDWLGDEYMKLPHVSVENKVNINTQDFVIIPEIFSTMMHDIRDFKCKKIVLCQSYHYSLELLNPGVKWQNYGFNDVITTSETQARFIKDHFGNINTHIIPVSIPDYFVPTKEMKKPIVTLVTREQSDALKIVKSFYLKFPMYKWVTFRELRGLPRKQFAEILGESCLGVWIDDVSGFGTFPLEAMHCDTPVIGKIPNLIPEWMLEEINSGDETKESVIKIKDNGVWTDNWLNIPNLIAEYMKVWLEDSVPQILIDNMNTTKNIYTSDKQKEKIKEVFSNLIEVRKKEISSLIELTKKDA